MKNPEMPLPEVKTRLAEAAGTVDAWLQGALRRQGVPEGLLAAMEYSLLAGGKRIRPVLCLISSELCGLAREAVMPYAAALECIHTYSLVHDDLPAMDDDDLRRGRPSNHKQFDEATAILAGDGLLTDAFALMIACADNGVPADRVLQAVALAARAAGSSGMVGGQFLDMQYTAARGVSIEELSGMHAMKTGAMLRLPCEAGAVLAGADVKYRKALVAYGNAVGAAFQITDDVLDEVGSEAELGKPVGSDAAKNKNTYPSLLGLEKSRVMAMSYADAAIESLQDFRSPAADLLRGLAGYIVNRLS